MVRDTTMIDSLRSPARKLTGYSRRPFQAEMTIEYCDVKPRRAESMFGWGRATFRKGIGELRSQIRCQDNAPAGILEVDQGQLT